MRCGQRDGWKWSVSVALGACLLIAGSLSAQAPPVVNPTAVTFTASPDHAVVSGYEWGTFAVGASAPTQTVAIPLSGLTAAGQDWQFAYPRLLFGTFDQKLRACAGSACSEWVAADRQAAVVPFGPSAVRLGTAGPGSVPQARRP